ncbi:MAG: hypothetical protein ACI9EZ_000357 [Halobacteriales archaeon]
MVIETVTQHSDVRVSRAFPGCVTPFHDRVVV